MIDIYFAAVAGFREMQPDESLSLSRNEHDRVRVKASRRVASGRVAHYEIVTHLGDLVIPGLGEKHAEEIWTGLGRVS